MRFLNRGALRIVTLLVGALLCSAPTLQAQTAGTVKVLDWNTHHGVGTDGVYNLQRFVSWIARSGAHVVSLNEVERFTSWGNEDQPARYASLLQAATGKTWYYTFAQRDGATKGQGNLILSTLPLQVRDATLLSYSRSVARAEILVNGVRVNMFSTHLDADSSARRAEQMNELKTWASRFPQQHIFAGDFNAWPGAAEISNMTAFAYDAWATAKNNGTAIAYAGNEAGNTRNSRIDYIWYSKGATKLALKSAQVFDTRDANGVMPSDHRPVMATFQVGSTTSRAAGPAPADFDGDRRSDLSLYRPDTGEWFASRSGGGMLQVTWGNSILGDIPAPGDYDGDGRADVAVFRPADGTWYLRYTSSGAGISVQWGSGTDVPVAGDYDGDGRTDLALFRPQNGTWYIRYMSTGAAVGVQWGNADDVPVPGDYDGDGRTDVAVFRPANGTWYMRYSANGRTAGVQWGNAADRPAPGDYDGDGKTDVVVFRPANGVWYLRYSSTGRPAGVQWGNALDRLAPGDYDGDGTTDLAVYRPSNAVWYIRYSVTGAVMGAQWGGGQDIPILNR